MKKLIPLIFYLFTSSLYAQTFTSGYTFSPGETNITDVKLNAVISGMTVSDIPGTALANTTITTGKIANNSITSAKILDSTIVSADVLPRGFTGGEIATNGITEIELNTNMYYRAGIHSFSNVTVAANSFPASGVNGVTTSAGAGDSGKIPKLNGSGQLDNSFIAFPSVLSSNRVTAASGSADTWTQIASLTTTITNGGVVVTGRGTAPVGNAGSIWIRVRSSDHTASATSGGVGTGPGGSTAPSLNVSMVDTLTTAAKTYVLEIADQTGGQTWVANAATGVRGVDAVTNNLGISILQYGK